MGLLLWVVFGLLRGAIAKWIMPGRDPGGIIVTILLGIGGARHRRHDRHGLWVRIDERL